MHCSRSSDEDSDEDEMEEDDLEEDENFEEGVSRARPGTSVSGVNGSSPNGGSPRGTSPRGRSPRAQTSMSSMQTEPIQVPDLEPEKQHSLEEALLKQMEMQKRLHEQLEVPLSPLTSKPLHASFTWEMESGLVWSTQPLQQS